MHLTEYLGKKLVDIGTDEDKKGRYLRLAFTGGHELWIRHNDIDRALLIKKPKKSLTEIEQAAEDKKKAMADARAKKAAKAEKGSTVKKAPAKRTTRKTQKDS